MSDETRRTPLYHEHIKLGARMVPFAGYAMPVQYPTGVLTEHVWTRENAGLSDVSHMGQATLRGPDFETTARALERLIPADVMGLEPGQQRYSQLLNDEGGIIDDLMVTRGQKQGEILLVVNASRKIGDYAWINERLPESVKLKTGDNLALLALQGPKANVALAAMATGVDEIAFMHSGHLRIGDIHIHASRSGYTGEDGFELSVLETDVEALWNVLLSHADVKPIGLGARDSLRLESGLCLYGHELDETTSPNEAGLMWSIAKRRRVEGGFIGAGRVQAELATGTQRSRVGIKPDGKAPAREGTIIQNAVGRDIGKITSGGFGPTVNGPVAMGYVETAFSAVPGENHKTFTAQDLTADLSGSQFRAVVMAPGGLTFPTGAARLLVSGTVSVALQPGNYLACVGDSALFQVKARSAGKNATYQWQQSSDGGKSFSDISGKTSELLGFAVDNEHQNGQLFRAKITAVRNSTASE